MLDTILDSDSYSFTIKSGVSDVTISLMMNLSLTQCINVFNKYHKANQVFELISHEMPYRLLHEYGISITYLYKNGIVSHSEYVKMHSRLVDVLSDKMNAFESRYLKHVK